MVLAYHPSHSTLILPCQAVSTMFGGVSSFQDRDINPVPHAGYSPAPGLCGLRILLCARAV